MASETVAVPLDGSAKAAPAAGAGDPAAPAGGAPPVDPGAAPAPGAEAEAPKGEEGEKGTPEAPVNPEELTRKPPKDPEQERAEAATGLDLTPFAEEYQREGKLSDESYAKLAEKGFSKDITDTYIAGVMAKAQVILTDIASSVGGVDNYNAILNWGKTGLSDAEKAQTVAALRGPPESAKVYLLGLQQRMIAANGKTPGKIAGGGSMPSEDVFADRKEQAKAMKDPRYKSDAKYRDEVIAKSVRSFGKGAKAHRKSPSKPASRRRVSTTTRRARSKGKR